jgi:hypothetical protein
MTHPLHHNNNNNKMRNDALPDPELSQPPIDVIEFDDDDDDDDGEHGLHRVSSLSLPNLIQQPKTSLDNLLDNIEECWQSAPPIKPNTTSSTIMHQADGDESDEISVISDPLETLMSDLRIREEGRQHNPHNPLLVLTPPSVMVFPDVSQHVDNLDPESSIFLPNLDDHCIAPTGRQSHWLLPQRRKMYCDMALTLRIENDDENALFWEGF